MYNHNKAQQSKNRVHISWDILYSILCAGSVYHVSQCVCPICSNVMKIRYVAGEVQEPVDRADTY